MTSGSWIEPTWFALDVSRGHETPDSKVFMRSTVLLSDLLVYFPAVFLFVKQFLRHRSGRTQVGSLILLQGPVAHLDVAACSTPQLASAASSRPC